MTKWREGREPPTPAFWPDIVAWADTDDDECSCVSLCDRDDCRWSILDALRDAVLLVERYRAALHQVERALSAATWRGYVQAGNSVTLATTHYAHLVTALAPVHTALDEGEGA